MRYYHENLSTYRRQCGKDNCRRKLGPIHPAGRYRIKFSKSSFSNIFDNWGLTFIHSYYMVITLSNDVYNHIMIVIFLEIKTIFLAMVSFL